MIHLSSEERALRKLMAISGVVYLVAGSAFAAAPGKLLSAINALSAAIAILLMRKALAPFKRLLYPHDHL